MSPRGSILLKPNTLRSASYEANKFDEICARSTFWRHARQRLDQIGNQITPADRSMIEAALAQRVQPTTGRASR